MYFDIKPLSLIFKCHT